MRSRASSLILDFPLYSWTTPREDFKRSHRPNTVAHHLNDFFDDVIRISLYPSVQDQEADRHLAFQIVFCTQNGAFSHLRVIGQNLFYGSGR